MGLIKRLPSVFDVLRFCAAPIVVSSGFRAEHFESNEHDIHGTGAVDWGLITEEALWAESESRAENIAPARLLYGRRHLRPTAQGPARSHLCNSLAAEYRVEMRARRHIGLIWE
jgi:hypothetical protein